MDRPKEAGGAGGAGGAAAARSRAARRWEPGGRAQSQPTADAPEGDDDAFDDGPEGDGGDGFDAAEPAAAARHHRCAEAPQSFASTPAAPEPVVHEPAPFAAAAPPMLEEPASAPAVSTPEPAAEPGGLATRDRRHAALGRSVRQVKLALVVQRYAEDIGGGSELHARYIAEHLAARADVRVLTTCARDYVSWKNEYPAGPAQVNGIPVERFTVGARTRALATSRAARRSSSTRHTRRPTSSPGSTARGR
jgi:hypothetical protein